MSYPIHTLSRSGDAPKPEGLRRRPIPWMVSALCLFASSMPVMESAHADNTVTMRSHRSVLDWMGPGAVASTTPAAPATPAKPASTVVELNAGDASHAREAARLARAVREDETRRLAGISSAAGQAQLARAAKADEDRRLAGAANAVGGPSPIEIAKAKEAKRIADEAREAEATLAEAKRATQAAQAAQAAEAKRIAQAAQAAEAKRIAQAAQAAEAKRIAQAAQAAEAQRLAQAAQAAEAKRLAQAAQAAEAQRLAQAAEAAEAQRLAQAAQAAEATRIAQAAEAAEATRIAQAAEAAEAQRLAQAAQAAEAQHAAQAARVAESTRVREASADEPLIVFKQTAPADKQAATLASPSASTPDLAGAWRPAPGRVWSASEFAAAPASRPAPALNLAAAHPTTPRAPASLAQTVLTPGDAPSSPDYAPPTQRKPLGKQAAGTFAQWLETQPDAFGNGPVPSEAEIRRIFNDAVKAAADRSPQVRQAYAEYQAANADVDEAKGQRWPQLDIGTQSPGLQFGPGAGNGSNPGSAITANVTTTVFDWGRTSKTIGSRKHLADAARQRYETELENSAYEVSNTLIELGKQRVVVELSQQFVDRMETLVKMLSEIVAVDRGRGSELTQAKTRLLQAQALRDAAEAKVRDAELTLTKLVGENAVMIPRTREWQLERGNLARLLAEVNDHPGIRQAQSEADAADLHVKAVRAAGLPQVNWVVSASTGRDSLGRRQPWQTMLTLNWAAFRGGSTSAATAAAGQRATASWQKIEQQRRDLEYGVRTADQDANTMLERANLYRGLSAETDRVRKAFFEQWYHLGRRTLLDVLIAENDHYGNQVSEVSNRFDSYQAVFREYASAGVLARWLAEGKA
ncbi:MULTISPECIES: TolC family protein [Burkholderia]|uniref:Adhesin transport system outer membrane protein n=1 Tax=Burkholderia pyrrocinia TaxID=60550 RepID=A0A318HSL2_BURPY|nr:MULTISPECIES: TolC family protein [Burkholderia]PXX21398.1 adhesin transport system outer membrane protein [Burkholderia pyrrocinia]SFY46515.1 outer membrane protein, adhesin transport system [Burkholderia sp. NFPP32]